MKFKSNFKIGFTCQENPSLLMNQSEKSHLKTSVVPYAR